MNSPFRVAVINDEIGQDFAHVVDIVSREFGMQWIELRGMWNKNILKLDSKEVDEARQLLEKAKLRVTDLATPVFKVDFPGAPLSKAAEKRDTFNADFTFKQQDELLERSFEMAKAFNTDRVRIFDFWRLDDQAPYRAAMDDKLREAADKAAKKNIVLILENEFACNTATGAEAARTLSAVQSPNFMVNWDPGNAAMRGENAFPDGYNKLPKDRIGHVHCKDIQKKPDGKQGWAAMGRGTIDWSGQFRALKQQGYKYATSLETHWRGAGTPEESTRQSWAGMKDELQKAGALA
ncbi:MAG TPA: sugar phosphate isomerase/epimerase family protein [Terriglobales bacterium]|nr:sugar phosphate isomerase/epimerase family protein [Terriglobales bacterium]